MVTKHTPLIDLIGDLDRFWVADEATESVIEALQCSADGELVSMDDWLKVNRIVWDLLGDFATQVPSALWQTLPRGYTVGQMGHDILLSLNGHGEGLWSGLGELGDVLHGIAKRRDPIEVDTYTAIRLY